MFCFGFACGELENAISVSLRGYHLFERLLVVCFTGVERQLSTPQVPWLHQRQPRVLRRKRDCTLPSSASTSSTSLCTSEEEGLHTGLTPHNVGMYLGGRGTGHLPHKIGEFFGGGGGTGPPPHNVGLYFGGGGTGLLLRNVGEYMQLVLRSQFRSLGALFLPPTAKSWKKRGMHCECKTCWWRVSSMSASRGAPALRMRMLTRAILTSVNNSKHVSVVPFGVIWTRVAGHTGNKMLGNNASVGSLVTATHLEENSSVASWGEGSRG